MSLSSLLNDPKHWQDRAAQAEALAEQITDIVGKATALSISEEYARLSRRAEERALVHLDGAQSDEVAGTSAKVGDKENGRNRTEVVSTLGPRGVAGSP
jgi:hypothetical protein